MPEETTPPPSRVVDLDAARVARQEAGLEPVAVRFGGRLFDCPPELPARFAIAAQRGDLEDAFLDLFADAGTAAAFWDLNPTVTDLEVLADGIAKLYGVTLGNSPASAKS